MEPDTDDLNLAKISPNPKLPVSEDLFRQAYQYQPKKKISKCQKLKTEVQCSKQTFLNLFPIVQWLPRYQWKTECLGDLVAGVTVAIMHIPHGLAYAPLGGQDPVVGLYMAVFAPLVYVFMGTSKHNSLGTFAVLAMMAGKSVSEHSASEVYTPLEVGITVCFTVGLWQLLLGVLRLGVVALLLSSSLVSGFTTAAAVHVTIYQIKNLLGIKVKNFSGPFKLIHTIINIGENVVSTNVITLGLSLSCLIVLFLFNEILKPKIQKRFPKFKVPFPIELTVIVAGILVSYFVELNEKYNVHIVGSVPTGMPNIMLPRFDLIPDVLLDGFVMAIVGISISLSLGTIFAKKSKYKLSNNQELLAYGAANIFSSFFHCLPSAASLSRSLVAHTVGGRSQLAMLVSILLTISILLFVGPLFEPVPYCVLSAIVVATLKGLVMQVTDFPKIYRQSTLDGLVWALTFCSVVLIDLDYGLLIGIVASVVTMLVRGYRPTFTILGQVPNTNVFLDADRYKATVRLPHVTIVHISGGLNFANAELANAYIIQQTEELRSVSADKTPLSVVVSMAAVAYMDPTAVSMLTGVYKDLKAENCDLYLAEMSLGVYDSLEHCGFFKQFPTDHAMATVFDAVEYLTNKLTDNS